MARPPTRQPFQPTSTAPATIGQGVQNVQRGVQQVAPQAAVPQATNVNVQQTVKTPAALQGLVNSIAQAEMLQSGQTLQQEGAEMMYAPGGGKKDNWRNAFAGSLRAHRGRKKVKEAIALEDQLMAEQAEKQRIANKLAQQQEMEARGQSAEIIAQLQPQWTRDQVIAAAAEVVAGRLAMKDIAEFNKVEGEPKPNLKEVKTIGPDGVETSQWVIVPEEGEAKPRVTGMPEVEEEVDDRKAWVEASGDIKTRAALTSSSMELVNQAVNTLFDENGKYRNVKGTMPYGEAAYAKADLREAMIETLRAVSGAAIPETEIEREVDSAMPATLDTDEKARAKLRRFSKKVEKLYSGLTHGYRDMPPELGSVTMTIPGDPAEKKVYATREEAEAALAQEGG